MASKKIHSSKKEFLPNFLYPQFANPFPRIYEFEKLQINSNLKPVKIISVKKSNPSKILFVKFSLQIKNSPVDVYLFVNKIKKDMFYSVSAGEYSFNDIELGTGENRIEIFYIQNKFKSKSTYLTVKL